MLYTYLLKEGTLNGAQRIVSVQYMLAIFLLGPNGSTGEISQQNCKSLRKNNLTWAFPMATLFVDKSLAHAE